MQGKKNPKNNNKLPENIERVWFARCVGRAPQLGGIQMDEIFGGVGQSTSRTVKTQQSIHVLLAVVHPLHHHHSRHVGHSSVQSRKPYTGRRRPQLNCFSHFRQNMGSRQIPRGPTHHVFDFRATFVRHGVLHIHVLFVVVPRGHQGSFCCSIKHANVGQCQSVRRVRSVRSVRRVSTIRKVSTFRGKYFEV